MIGSIVISHNPVESHEIFNKTLVPGDWANYSHEIRAMGGYWEASFDMLGHKLDLEDMFIHGLGREVGVYSKYGVEVWRGFINDMEFRAMGMNAKMSFDSMWNSLRVRYDNGSARATATASYQASINKWGTKLLVLSAGKTTAANAGQVANTVLGITKIPRRTRTTIRSVSRGQTLRLSIKCHGWIRRAWWDVYLSSDAGSQAANLEVQDIADDQGWIRDTVIDSNATSIARTYSGADRRHGDILFDIARHGDSSYNRWIVYVKNQRTLYFKQALSPSLVNVRYTYRASDPRGVLIDRRLGEISACELWPDSWIRLADIYPQFSKDVSNLYEDEQIVYVESVRFREPDNFEITGGAQAFLDFLTRKASMGNTGLT